MNTRTFPTGWLSRLLRKRSATSRQLRGAQQRVSVALAVGVVVFLAVQVALVGASSTTHAIDDPVYADKEYRLRKLEAESPSALRVILLGTSRAGYGFAAGYTQQAARAAGVSAVVFNFGIPGAGPVTHLIYLRRLIRDGHRPDLLILEVLPPLLADLPNGPLESRALAGDLLSREEIAIASNYGVSTKRMRRQWIEANTLPIFGHRFKLLGRVSSSFLPWQLRYDAGRTPDPNGWNASIVTEVTPEEHAFGVARATTEYRDVFKCDLPAGPAVRALRDMLAMCRGETIPVALVIFPEATSFRALYQPHTEENLSRLLAELYAEFSCSLTDARLWLPDEAFLDGHHLIRTHAEVFTIRFTRELILPLLQAKTRRARE
ncbi:MAG: DUF1574 domain-containing protein [Planctomycetia bacterium]|nr:DUF1574 domain-containing protein [Planctomycetia bacterium]